MKKKIVFLFAFLVLGLASAFAIATFRSKPETKKTNRSTEEIAQRYDKYVPLVTLTPAPTISTTPKQLTFSEKNALYGPCIYLPTLFYHHIENMTDAISKHQQNLTVTPEVFEGQMKYLSDKGYKTATMQDLVNFFDNGTPIAQKSVILTVDDAYDDFILNALPIITKYGFNVTLFTPTGLVDNPGYVSWDQILSAAQSGKVFFANHTWSHKNMQNPRNVVESEISTADIQLGERGLNSPKIFAYPYGLVSDYAKDFLKILGYKAAFTTRHDTILCAKQRFELPRVRIGNRSLNNFGF